MSYHDALADFIAFMESNGIRAIEPIAQRLATGALIRFRCEGDGKGRQNGWAILYLDDRPAGAFGNYRLNTGTLKWKSGNATALTSAEREQMQREWQQTRERREAERMLAEREASRDAAEMWERAAPADPQHGYVTRKLIDPTPLRQLGNRLLVPMYDVEGRLWNLQRIAPDGEKRFLKGGRVDDLFCIIGEFSRAGEQCVIGEGYATVSAAHASSGYPGVVAFNSPNLLRVARLWNGLRPDLNYIIFADDDAALLERAPFRNVGLEAAQAAAAEIGARVATPLGRAA
jgi:putative DNA primase/helicase